jgi:hypothetical protein
MCTRGLRFRASSTHSPRDRPCYSRVAEELEGYSGEYLELRGGHFVPTDEGDDFVNNSGEVLLGDAVSAEHNPSGGRKNVSREVRARSHPCGFEGTRESNGGRTLRKRTRKNMPASVCLWSSGRLAQP